MKINRDIKLTEKFIWNHRNTFLIIVSIIVAILILRSELIHNFIDKLGDLRYFGVFIAGIFFSYGFTTAPAMSILYLLSENINIFLVALLGAMGAMISDFLIFSFVKYEITEEIKRIGDEINFHPKFKHIKLLKKIAPFIGGFIIASPLPDELAAVILGSIKLNNKKFLIISFLGNFVGILTIAILSKIT